jgi:hypothetical protein
MRGGTTKYLKKVSLHWKRLGTSAEVCTDLLSSYQRKFFIVSRDSQTTVLSFGFAYIDEDQIFGQECGFHIMFVPSHTANAFSETVL